MCALPGDLVNLCILVDRLIPDLNDRTRYQNILTALSEVSPEGYVEYCKELQRRSNSPLNFHDYLAEARVALLFVDHGFDVQMRHVPSCPDLRIVFQGGVINVEVKHFRKKDQDDAEIQALVNSTTDDLFVPYGDTMWSEGSPSWRQIYNTLRKKQSQLISGEPNFIAFVSDTNAIEDVEMETAINEVNDNSKDFSRLNGTILISNWFSIRERRSVFIYSSSGSDVHIPAFFSTKLAEVRRYRF